MGYQLLFLALSGINTSANASYQYSMYEFQVKKFHETFLSGIPSNCVYTTEQIPLVFIVQ